MFYLGLFLAVIATLAACTAVTLLINGVKFADIAHGRGVTADMVPSFQLPQANFAPPVPVKQDIVAIEPVRQQKPQSKKKKKR